MWQTRKWFSIGNYQRADFDIFCATYRFCNSYYNQIILWYLILIRFLTKLYCNIILCVIFVYEKGMLCELLHAVWYSDFINKPVLGMARHQGLLCSSKYLQYCWYIRVTGNQTNALLTSLYQSYRVILCDQCVHVTFFSHFKLQIFQLNYKDPSDTKKWHSRS